MTDNPLTNYNVDPEFFEVATEYVKHLDINKTALALNLPAITITEVLNKKEVKRFIDAIFLQQGFMQRNKLNDVLTKIIDKKLEELEENEMGSNKDILEILKFAHTMQMDHAKMNKEEAPGIQQNIQNNFGGENYSKLLSRIVSGDKELVQNGSK